MKNFCGKCKTNTNQKVLFDKTNHIHEEDGWQEYNHYQVIECGGCDTISFRKLHTDIAMNSNWNPEEGPEPFEIELYPNRSIHHLLIHNYDATPKNINIIYQETINAYNNNQLLLCSGGLRAIIEGVCNERGITGADLTKGSTTKFHTSLEAKIEGLAQNGLLTESHASILHNLRFIGNDALHELSIPTKAELKLGVDIVEYIIESLYEIKQTALHLKNKFTERKSPKTP